jgi:hypothetical protein
MNSRPALPMSFQSINEAVLPVFIGSDGRSVSGSITSL